MTACAPAGPAEPTDMSAEAAAAIREADRAFEAAARTGDMEAAMAMHTDDAMVFPPGQPMVSGQALLRALWTEMTSAPGFAITWQVSGTSAAASGDVGYSWGTAQLTMNGPDGTPMSSQEKYVTIWRKQADGTWKVAVDMFNSNTPPPGMGG
jgi:ketosteroid isomerase-like protein